MEEQIRAIIHEHGFDNLDDDSIRRHLEEKLKQDKGSLDAQQQEIRNLVTGVAEKLFSWSRRTPAPDQTIKVPIPRREYHYFKKFSLSDAKKAWPLAATGYTKDVSRHASRK